MKEDIHMIGQALAKLVIGAGLTVSGILIGVAFVGGNDLIDIQNKTDQTVQKYNQLKDKYLHEVTEANHLIDSLLKEVDRSNHETKRANEAVADTKNKVTDKTKDVLEDKLDKLPTVTK